MHYEHTLNTMITQIFENHVTGKLTWSMVVDALEAGHQMPRAKISDQVLERGVDTLVSRAAWIDGLGFGVKSFSVMPENTKNGMQTVQGAMLLFDDASGAPQAVIDSYSVTKWKTAADSALGARYLARSDSESLLIVGAGEVANNLIHAYLEIFPQLKSIAIWNRTAARAEQLASKLADEGLQVQIVTDLQSAVSESDIVATATLSHEPIVMGDWVRPGTHIDLIGAFKSDMREADDVLLQKSRLFVDSRETTIHDNGELVIPITSGAISEEDVIGDLYDLVSGTPGRLTDGDITVFKNSGGAHLDLMAAALILNVVSSE